MKLSACRGVMLEELIQVQVQPLAPLGRLRLILPFPALLQLALHTIRFESTAKVLAKHVRTYCRTF